MFVVKNNIALQLGKVYSIVEVRNFRKKLFYIPNLLGKELSKLDNGDIFLVIEKKSNSCWNRIILRDMIGWIWYQEERFTLILEEI